MFLIGPDGVIRGLYTDDVPWKVLGRIQVRRASTVEFDETGQGWIVTILETREILGPFARRRDAIDAEVAWLTAGCSRSFSPAAMGTEA